jgi:hypothetical protein
MGATQRDGCCSSFRSDFLDILVLWSAFYMDWVIKNNSNYLGVFSHGPAVQITPKLRPDSSLRVVNSAMRMLPWL